MGKEGGWGTPPNPRVGAAAPKNPAPLLWRGRLDGGIGHRRVRLRLAGAYFPPYIVPRGYGIRIPRGTI